jgi:hypothetical protein
MTGVCAALAGGRGVGGTVVTASFSGSTVTFSTDGTTNDPVAPAWYAPSSVAIGSSYWFRLTRTGGTGGTSFSPASGSWVSLATQQIVSVGGGAGICSGTMEFATDSGGVNVVATSAIAVNNAG